MGEIINQIFGWSTEELRKELCAEIDKSDLFRIRASQIKDKFREITEMLDKQLESHKEWD